MTQFYYLTAKTPLEKVLSGNKNGVHGKGIRFGLALMRRVFI